MYILLESASGTISDASIWNIDVMGTAQTEQKAMEWRDENPDYRTYKYVPLSQSDRIRGGAF